MHVQELVGFADSLSDNLTAPPPGAAGTSGGGASARWSSAVESTTDVTRLIGAARPVDDDRHVLALIAAFIRLRNVADHGIAAAVAMAEQTGIPTRKHVRNGGTLLKEMGMAPSAAYRSARIGRAADEVPEVTRGMCDGAVSAEFGDAVCRGLALVGKRVDLTDGQAAQIIRSLMVQSTPKEVGHRARAWAISLAPEGSADREVPVAEDVELNEMTLNQNDEGRISVTLELDVVSGEELSAAIDPLTRPVPEPDGSNDRRSAARRRADALAQVVRSYLAGSGRPESGGVLPHVTLVVPVGITRNGRVLADGDDSVVTIPVADLDRPVEKVPALGFTGPVSARTAELVMCEASVAAALLDGEGVPLNVSREERLFTPGIRKALMLRDGGCAFPGCGAPPSHCDAHHVDHWSHGGVTSLANGVLLCRRHHTLVHLGEWVVYLGRDGHPWFLPPVDAQAPSSRREPLRSHGRRTLNNLPRAA
ncbi:HNH endonuclease signature motif containing protein [Gordonia caeni]|uniref:HNH endonuclease signature motif containing protein n=1 Tax=Gordonia caeni TaxID=1007097 RepID=A0ABP7NQ93_9ACTN